MSDAVVRLRVPLAITAIGLTCLAGLVYTYPSIFDVLDGTRPDRFEQRVEAALQEGNASRAVTIAREAVRWQPLEPAAHAAYTRALIASGKMPMADDAATEALQIPTTPGPEYRPTHKPFFYAPTRLALARLAVNQNDMARALQQIVYARVYADLNAAEFNEYRDVIASVYAAFELPNEDFGIAWTGIRAMEDGSTITPGWIDVARDWYAIRADHAGRIETDGERTTLVVTNDDIHKMALYYSVPVAAEPDAVYRLEGAMLAPATPGVLGWQALDADERVIDEGWLFDQERTGGWESRSVEIPGNYFYAELRVVLGVTRHAGVASFSGVGLNSDQTTEGAEGR